jgi:hypothetical protein
MLRFLFLILLCFSLLTGCRYWVLYKFADQFCDYDQYVELGQSQHENTIHLQIRFLEPVLDRHILLRYLNAAPFLSHYDDKAVISRDEFAFRPVAEEHSALSEVFTFSAGYHALDGHALLASAQLDAHLSRLFPPALVEPILRSICSDDYDLSNKQLDMRFRLANLDKANLPERSQIEAIMGKAQSIDEKGHAYHFDFLIKDQEGRWQPQQKPIILVFRFDISGKLEAMHIDYFMYRYWLDIESASGRLLVLRK